MHSVHAMHMIIYFLFTCFLFHVHVVTPVLPRTTFSALNICFHAFSLTHSRYRTTAVSADMTRDHMTSNTNWNWGIPWLYNHHLCL